MGATEVAPVSLGPQYAPDDPTLLKPWKGLIDGSTGVLYYWNPESNVTQYERPASLDTSSVLSPTTSTFTPKLTPIPVARPMHPNGVQTQQSQHISQQHDGQQMSQGVQPWSQYTSPQQNTQVGEVSQHYATQSTQGVQQQGPPTVQGVQPIEQMMPQHQNFHQPRQHIQKQLGPQSFQYEVQQMPHLQEQRFPSQQPQQMPYQQTPHMQGQHNTHPQTQLYTHQEGQKMEVPHAGGFESQQGKDSRLFSSQVQQLGGSSLRNFPHPSQQRGPDPIDRQQSNGPMRQHQTGPTMIHVQQQGGPSVRPMLGREEESRGVGGNGYLFNADKEGLGFGPQQSNLATRPIPQIQQDMRAPQRVAPSHGGHAAGLVRPHLYNNTVGGQAFAHTPSGPPLGVQSSSSLTNLSAAEAYCREHEVSATGDNVPAPFMTFEATGFPPEILREIRMAGFSSPTPIQAQTWPIALQSKDIVAIAKTGSGKTLGYIIPAFIHLRESRNSPQNGPTVLILAPTRELATQIQDEVIKFGRSSRISCTCLYGGAPKGPQLKELDRGAEIVVATPGRLNDILEMNKIDFRQVSFLVLDEADRMLDMGFEPQIRTIVNKIPPRRQTLMYTATWPKEVRKIAGDLLVNPVQVNIGSVDVLAANKAITQYVEVVPQQNKQRRLEQILRDQERGSRAIIFCSTKRLCDHLTRSIGRSFGAAAIHGDKSQSERDWVLNQFRSGKCPILVATDVAARGLDVKDIRVVINYDFPTGIEDYVHRIGRTGRAGAAGVAYTFFSDQDRKHASDLVKVLEGANQIVPPEVQEMAGRGGSSYNKVRGGMSRWDSSGGQSFSGGRGGMRDDAFDNRGSGMRDGGRGGDMRDGGRGVGMHDGSFGGRGGRNNFGGRGNRGQRYPGPDGGSVGWDRHDNGPHARYNDGPGQRNNGRGGRSFSGNHSRNADMVSTYSRSHSSSRSSSRSRSRSRTPPRRRSRSPRRSKFSSALPPPKQDLLSGSPTELKVSSVPPGAQHGSSSSVEPSVKLLVTENTASGGAPAGAQPDMCSTV